jgi:hypothetical protein
MSQNFSPDLLSFPSGIAKHDVRALHAIRGYRMQSD